MKDCEHPLEHVERCGPGSLSWQCNLCQMYGAPAYFGVVLTDEEKKSLDEEKARLKRLDRKR